MRIQVGIHENVILAKVGINDKGRLILTLRQLGEEKQTEDDPFAQGNAAEVIEADNGGGLTLWPFKVPDAKDTKGNVRTDKERGELANKDIMRLKNQCQLILEQYMPKDQIKWSIWEGAAMAKETFYEDLCSQSNLDCIYRNIGEQFAAMIQPFLDNDKYPMRWKLPRQSKEKHFATLPGMYLNEQPFIEPMEIPKEQAKVKWSKYEEQNGLNDGTPVSKDTADKNEETPEGENVFGNR